jgi:hypothetical protein
VNTATGVITINGIIPINDIAFPNGATHMSIKGAWAKVDFSNGTYQVELTNTTNAPIDAAPSNVVLTPSAVPAGTGVDLFLLMVEFYQEVNAVQYSLKNGAYNALSIVEVN